MIELMTALIQFSRNNTIKVDPIYDTDRLQLTFFLRVRLLYLNAANAKRDGENRLCAPRASRIRNI